MQRTTKKYPGVYQDKKGQWFYQTTLGHDTITGKKITKKGRTNQFGKKFESAKDANDELMRIKVSWSEAHGYGNYELTYKQFINDYFTPYYETKVQKQTFISKEPSLKKLISRFGKSTLRNIRASDCEIFRVWLLSKPSGYSQSYASGIYTLFRQSLDYAVTLGFIEQNESKKTPAISKSKVKVNYWTKSEFESVINSIFIDDLYEHLTFISLWIYYLTGIRVSEGLALQWADVDFKNSRLRINKTLDRTLGKNWKIQTHTKTDNGMRIISLDSDTIFFLRRWRMVQQQLGIDDFIFSYSGEPLSRSTIMRMINKHAKLSGVHPIQGKGLRHSHVSYLINEFNADVLTISRRLGHSSPEITLRYYAHLWPVHDEEITKLIKGNIAVNTAGSRLTKFYGNQSYKLTSAKESAKNSIIA